MSDPLILIDAGHGGKDTGGMGNGLIEKDITLQLSLRIKRLLEQLFICDVELTRSTDVTMSLNERTSLANRFKVDLYYSVHINATKDAEGFESYIHNSLSSSSKTAEIQKIIHGYIKNAILKRWNIKDRGMKKANFHVLRETGMSAVLAEYLFIDNIREANLLKDYGFLNALAEATAQGIGMALNLKRRKDEPKNSGKELWIVQAGAFHDKENATKRLQKLKESGITDAFIKKG